MPFLKGATSWFVHLEKFNLNFSSWSFAICGKLLHPILVTFWFTLVSSVFVYPGKLLFQSFPPINNNFQRPKKLPKIS